MARKNVARAAVLLASALLFGAFLRPVQAQDIGRIVAAVRQMFAGSVAVVAPTDGQILKYTAATNTWAGGSGTPPSGPAGGDLAGTYPNPTLAKISALGAHSVTLSEGASALGGVAPVASGSLLASAGVASDPAMVTLGVFLDTLGALPGDQLVRGTTTAGWGRVAAGTSTYVWTSNGPLTVPSWQAPATVSLQGAYSGGTTIAEAGGNPVAISSTTADNGNVLTVTKNPAGAQSGSGVLTTMGATTTGNAFQATMTAGATGFSFLGSATGGGISCPGAGGSSERFGNGATSAGATSSTFGNTSSSGGVDSTAFGFATAAGGTGGTALGARANTGANTYAIAIGNLSATTDNNQLVIGAATGAPDRSITSVYIGSGVTDTAPASVVFHASGSSTNGTAGAKLTIAGGLANQASDSGGSVSLQTAITGTGTTLVDRVKPNAVAKSLTNNTLTSLVTATLATDDVSGFKLSYSVRVSDSVGHHNQVESGIVQFSAGNNNGTVGTPVVSVCGVPARYLDSGTLTVTWDVTQSGATGSIRVNVNSSLTATTETITYTILNDSDASLAVQ